MAQARTLRTLVSSQLGVVLLAALFTGLLAVYVISPRFGPLTIPSLVDDWDMLYYAPTAFHQLEHFTYHPAAYDALRYRPTFWGIWSYLQWHTLGAPRSMRGPNVWNLVRVGSLALALSLLAAAAIRPHQRRELRPLSLGLLAALPGVLLFSTPAFGVDLARFGPQEPLLIAALGLGGLALLTAVWMLLEHKAHVVVAALVGLVGLLAWAFGVYMKEAAVCVFVLAPFVWLEVRSRWHPRRASRATLAIVVVLGVLALVPLAHLTVQLIEIAQGPKLVYGTVPPHGLGAWVTRIRAIIEQQWNGIPVMFGQALWQGLALALPPLLLAVWLRTRRPQWLALGMLLFGWSVLVFQGLPLVVDPRYYMPVFAAFTISLVALLAELPAAMRAAALAGVAVIALQGVTSSHTAIRTWVAGEKAGQLLVQATAELNPRHCPVYYTNFDPERRTSLPVLLAALYPDVGTTCLGPRAYLVVDGGLGAAAGEPILAACAPPGWHPEIQAGLGTIYSCERLRKAPVTLPDGSKMSPSQILDEDRLVVPAATPAS